MNAERIETRLMAVLDGADLLVRGIENGVADTRYPVDLVEVLGSEWSGRVFWCIDQVDKVHVLWAISDPDVEFLIEGSFPTYEEAYNHARVRAAEVRRGQIEFLRAQAIEKGLISVQARLEGIR